MEPLYSCGLIPGAVITRCEEVQKSYGVLSMIDTLKATLVPVMGAKVPLCNDFVEGSQAI